MTAMFGKVMGFIAAIFALIVVTLLGTVWDVFAEFRWVFILLVVLLALFLVTWMIIELYNTFTKNRRD